MLVVAGDAVIFVHVESHYVAERNLPGFIEFDEGTVHALGRAALGATEHERMFLGRMNFVDAGGVGSSSEEQAVIPAIKAPIANIAEAL